MAVYCAKTKDLTPFRLLTCSLWGLFLNGSYVAGMRILKMCAWEDEFFRRVTRAREDEVRELRRFVYTRAVIIVTWVRVSGGGRKERPE
jgi:hypothetical protein